MAQWNVVGQEPDAPPKTQWKTVGQEPDTLGVGDVAKGIAQLAGASVMNIPHGVIAGVQDIYHRLTGNANAPTTKMGEFPIEPGTPGARLMQALESGPTSPDEQMRNQRRAELQQGIEGTTAGDITQGIGQVGKDVLDIAPGATIGASLARQGARAFAEAAGKGTDWNAAGLRTGGGHPIARQVAGESGQEALVGHNAQIGNAVSATEAGHAPEAPISYESLADARAEPSAVWNRIANTLPEGQLNSRAQSTLTAAGQPGGTLKPSLQVQAQIDATKQQLLDATTGQQHIENLRTLRQQGFKNAASEVPADQELGKAQLDMSKAVEQHIEDTLPENGPVSIEQFRDSRKQLAKNWAVQGALRGNDVDLAALGRIRRNNPDVLDGGLKMLADFAEGPGRDVVGIPNRYNPPSVFSDVANVVNVHRPVQSTIQGIPGVGSTARKFLTGNTQNAIDQALSRFPGRAPGTFAPLPSAQLPSGRFVRPGETGDIGAAGLGIGANPNAAASQPLGDLARVMSEGVEQNPPAGLSSGPMGTPQGEGLTFRAPPESVGARFVQGGPRETVPPRYIIGPEGEPVETGVGPQGSQLGNRLAPSQQPEKLGDVAKVMSQGVPEDIATRTPPRPAVTHEVDEDTGAHVARSQNGETHAQENGPYLMIKRADTAKAAQGTGENTARLETLVQQAEARGLKLGSDVSVAPGAVKSYQRLERQGYSVQKNPFTRNPTTGNLVSKDPRKPVFEVSSRLGTAF